MYIVFIKRSERRLIVINALYAAKVYTRLSHLLYRVFSLSFSLAIAQHNYACVERKLGRWYSLAEESVSSRLLSVHCALSLYTWLDFHVVSGTTVRYTRFSFIRVHIPICSYTLLCVCVCVCSYTTHGVFREKNSS